MRGLRCTAPTCPSPAVLHVVVGGQPGVPGDVVYDGVSACSIEHLICALDSAGGREAVRHALRRDAARQGNG